MITNADLWGAVWMLTGAVAVAAIFLGAVLWAGFTIKIGKDVREIKVRPDRQYDMRNFSSDERNALIAAPDMLIAQTGNAC